MLYFDVTTNVKKKGSHGINIGGLVQLDVIKIFEFKADWIENPGIGYWKKFPEKSMSHAAFLGKKWVSTHEIQLEIVYKKTLSDDPKLRNLEKAWKKSGISSVTPPIFGNSFRNSPICHIDYI